MILQLALDLPEDQAYLKLTRIFGRTLLEHMKVCEEDVNDLEIVVGELCSNVVRHACSFEKRFRVVLEYYPDHVVLMVEDHGRGFSFKDVPSVGTRSRADFDGGSRIGELRKCNLFARFQTMSSSTKADPNGWSLRRKAVAISNRRGRRGGAVAQQDRWRTRGSEC